MATLAELKTRIIAETNRDDMGSGGELETTLALTIDRAIEFYANQLFWFNRKAGTITTANGTATAAFPTGMRQPTQLGYLGRAIPPVDLEDIQFRIETGPPSRWASNGNTVQLWPIPDGAYAVSVYGTADLGTPATSNAWTTEAYDLIAARVRFILYRDYLRDGQGAALAKGAEDEALAELRRETRKRNPVGRTTDLPRTPAFNIVRG